MEAFSGGTHWRRQEGRDRSDVWEQNSIDYRWEGLRFQKVTYDYRLKGLKIMKTT